MAGRRSASVACVAEYWRALQGELGRPRHAPRAPLESADVARVHQGHGIRRGPRRGDLEDQSGSARALGYPACGALTRSTTSRDVHEAHEAHEETKICLRDLRAFVSS